METERSHMTEQILDLSLEIIYLLTGENYIAFKLSDGVVTPNLKRTKPLGVEPPPVSMTPGRDQNKNFLEVTKKLIELLTGEVPIRCQDVAVYLSMEEREYLEGHCDRYKAAMMKEEPPLTVPEESRKTNSPEPHSSRYSCQDSAQEEHRAPPPLKADQQSDIKVETPEEECPGVRSEEPSEARGDSPGSIKDTSCQKNLPERCSLPLHPQDSAHLPVGNRSAADAEDFIEDVNGEERCKEETLPQISADGSYVQNPSNGCPPPFYSLSSAPEEPRTTNNYQGAPDSDEEIYIRGADWGAKKENPPEMGPDESAIRNNVAGCPRPLYYSTQEELNNLQHYEGVIKVEDTDEEEADERDPEPSAQRKILSEISTDERYVHNHSNLRAATTQAEESMGNDLPEFPCESPTALNFHPIYHSGELSADPTSHGRGYPGPGHPVHNDRPAPWIDLMAPCYELNNPNRTLPHVKKSFSCLNCGKSFKHKSKLETHERTHNGHRPYACSVCEKRFTQKAHLDTHTRIHTGEKPFVCLTCGRNFRDRSSLITHQRTHTGLRPYSCLRCGKKFRRKMHQKEHICDHLAHHFT